MKPEKDTNLEPKNSETTDQYVSRCMLFPEMQQYPETERHARCVVMYAAKGTSNQTMTPVGFDVKQRKIGFDTIALDGKVIVDDDKSLVAPAILASEIVHLYDDGYAYKPADELERAAWTAEGRWVKILSHPGADTNYLLQKQGDIYGRVRNASFAKNLIDAKTKRPCRRGIRADIEWFKDRTPADVLDKIRSGELHDVSIGFTFDRDFTPGVFEGMKYNYVQRNIFIDHVAAPIESGRCPGPICGIGFDSASMIAVDDALVSRCPVCRRIRDVGFEVAGQRLYKQYGADVLEVIEGNPLPVVVVPETNLDAEFNKALGELKRRLTG